MRTVLTTITLFLTLTASVDACQRCGLFGLRCRYYKAPVYVQPVKQYVQQPYVAPQVVYQQPEVFVVQNNYPPANAYANLIGKQGNTVYGLQEARIAYDFNANEYIRASERLAQDVLATAKLAISTRNSEGLAALQVQSNIVQPLIQSKAAVDVLNAAGINKESIQAQVQSYAFKIEFKNGKPEIVIVDPNTLPQQTQSQLHPNTLPPPSPVPTPENTSLIAQKCGKCHGNSLAEPKGGVYIDPANKVESTIIVNSLRLIKENKMPKDEPLTDEEKGKIFEELLALQKEGV